MKDDIWGVQAGPLKARIWKDRVTGRWCCAVYRRGCPVWGLWRPTWAEATAAAFTAMDALGPVRM